MEMCVRVQNPEMFLALRAAIFFIGIPIQNAKTPISLSPKAAKILGYWTPHGAHGNTWRDLWDIEDYLRLTRKKLTRKKTKISPANAENAVFFRVP